jgi:alkaline phosphatase
MHLGGEPTSVAIKNGQAFVGINTSPNYVEPSGHLLIVDLDSGKEVTKVELGGQPDSVAVSPDGTFVAIAIENERNEDINDEKIPQLPGGFVAIVNLADNSVTKADLVGFSTIAPNDPEPEFVDINNLGEIVVTIQENNWMAVIDRSGKVISEFDAGLVTLEGVDNKKDGELKMVDTIENVRREPDAVKWIDNDHFATANEGDYKHEAPGQAKRGGSRGWTIFNKNGSVVYESGSSYERALASAGYWPEKRAEKKGVEPESVEVAMYGDTRYIFVGAERANAIGVYKANDLTNPELVTILPTGIGPEGLVAIPQRNLFISANEKDLEKSVTIYSLD